jgi:hypothetical protein
VAVKRRCIHGTNIEVERGVSHERTKEDTMNPLYDTLLGLAPNQDMELLDGYQRYVGLLNDLLTPQQIETYADYIQRSGTLRILEELTADELTELTPQENALVTSIIADENAAMENRRVAALLNQRGQHQAAPDLKTPEIEFAEV